MWTTKIIKKEYVLGKDTLQVEVEYKNDNEVLVITQNIKNITQLKKVVREKITELENLQSNFDSLSKGALDYKEEKINMTQSEIDKKNYLIDVSKYVQTERAISMGILPSNSIDTIKTKLKNNFIPEYLNIL